MARMTTRQGQDYSAVAKLLHWLMAVVIVAAWIFGFLQDDMPNGPERLALINTHKAIGSTVLVLVALRILWRFFNPAPPLPGAMATWLQLAARAGHLVLYLLMLALPLSGWLISSAFGYPVMLAGLIELPSLLAEKNPSLGELVGDVHGAMAWFLLLVVAGHAAMALKHHFIDRDEVLSRMLPRLPF
ncbi:cytochrome b [Zavarzinia sp.]|uniref:cytochrome b n=1 Tax=Zavarzinia sp. TaxID=2027920 RepID=UPI003569B14F